MISSASRRWGSSQARKGFHYLFHVCEVCQQRIWFMRQKVLRAVEPTRSNRDCTRAKVTGTGNVVGGVADDDELVWPEIKVQVTPDSLRGEQRQIAAIMRLVAKRSGYVEEF
jgi:hypothetical protein